MSYYDALIQKWRTLGPPSLSDAVVAEAVRLSKTPAPVEPTVSHWVSPVSDEQKADVQQHQDWLRSLHAWHLSWASLFRRPELLAKLATLNDAPMIDAHRRNRERFVQVSTDDKGRGIFENPLELVQVPGAPWWRSNGYSSPISHTDLEAVFVQHGKVLV